MGSTAVTTEDDGTYESEIRYRAYGADRYTNGTQATDQLYTGQQYEEAGDLDLYDYGARFYDPALSRFISPDSIVPQPGDPQSLNRYAYVNNNPLRYVDPTGHAGCSPNDQQCWVNEWNWKNRWYNAHGYLWGGSHWSDPGQPKMADVGIAKDVMGEAGIRLSGSGWSEEYIKEMAVGAATFGLKLVESGGLARLKDLLGGRVRVRDWSCPAGAACAPGSILFAWEIWFPPNFDLKQVAGLFVHELGHVIDWQSRQTFSNRWSYGPLTKYTGDPKPTWYGQKIDVWAEAVAVWVMGAFNATGSTFTTSYKWGEVGSFDPGALAVQMHRMHELLNGWR